MENIIDLIATDASASEVSDTIKNQLFAKAAQRVEMGRPEVAAKLFADTDEVEGAELEVEPDQESYEDQE
tara:strand:- start:322 stop:531 length:210 start_codon:yes stop_codon:yes gene_type:complete